MMAWLLVVTCGTLQ